MFYVLLLLLNFRPLKTFSLLHVPWKKEEKFLLLLLQPFLVHIALDRGTDIRTEVGAAERLPFT